MTEELSPVDKATIRRMAQIQRRLESAEDLTPRQRRQAERLIEVLGDVLLEAPKHRDPDPGATA